MNPNPRRRRRRVVSLALPARVRATGAPRLTMGGAALARARGRCDDMRSLVPARVRLLAVLEASGQARPRGGPWRGRACLLTPLGRVLGSQLGRRLRLRPRLRPRLGSPGLPLVTRGLDRQAAPSSMRPSAVAWCDHRTTLHLPAGMAFTFTTLPALRGRP
jgi:hypothetical protein